LSKVVLPAVSPHDGPAFSAADGEIEPFVNNTRAETLVQILKDGHLFAGSQLRLKGLQGPVIH
jgi:hypothetical protein